MSLSTLELPYKMPARKDSPYYREFLPEPMFEGIWAKAKQMCIGFLAQQDPERAQFYQENIPKVFPELDKSFYKDSYRAMFVGCTDPQSVAFQFTMRSLVGTMANYSRFCLERMMYKEELDKIPLKKFMYIINLPRSGSTFTHRILANDPSAQTISMYQQLCPGSKTMSLEGRYKIAGIHMKNLTGHDNDMNKCHNLDDLLAPEEEIFFMEILACSYVYGSCMTRWEQYREEAFNKNWDDVYEGMVYDLKMAIAEKGLRDDQFLMLKCAAHFMTPIPLFKILFKDEYEPRIVWIHREPVEQFKSSFYLLLNCRDRFKGDIGEDDMEWFQRTVLEFTDVCLKNTIFVREKWLEENPERKKFIFDMGFKDMITDPVGTTKKIYAYYGMEVSDEMVEGIKHTVEKKDPQGKHGRKEKDENDFLISDDEIREKFKWYYEKFPEYLPNYWGKK